MIGLCLACILMTRSSIVWSASNTGLSYERCELLDSLERPEKRDLVELKDSPEPQEAPDRAEWLEPRDWMEESSLRGVWSVLGSLRRISSAAALSGEPGRGREFAGCGTSPGFEPG
jgi:hypothetical protein